MWTAGQCIGLIHDIPTCEELVKRIEREALDTLRKARDLYVEEGATPAPGAEGSKVNTPAAEVWGIGRSKL